MKLICSSCDDELEFEELDLSRTEYLVKSCKTCKEQAHDAGYDAGNETGYDSGYQEGCNEAEAYYQEGYNEAEAYYQEKIDDLNNEIAELREKLND
jgi:flagellar biosynthesis/type III secretory pathway protein FliH